MKITKWVAVILPLSLVGYGFFLKNQEKGDDVLLRAVFENLNYHHYSPVKMDDEFSKKAFEAYLESIDNGKRFLLKSDYEQLKKHEKQIDNQVQNGQYNLLNDAIKVLDNRVSEARKYYVEILDRPFDFTKDESVDFSDDIDYAKNTKELKERWRKYLKYNVLTRLSTDLDTKEKGDSSLMTVSLDSLERKARLGVLKTHNEWFNRLEKLRYKDRLSQYVNALTGIYDPHTNYFPPKDKEDFDIRMSGRLEGIGAQLQEKDGYIKVVRVIPGGPASLQGDLSANDVILKVAQEGEDAVEIVDWRIDDAVKLIRGKKGTKVTLTVRKPNATVQEITIKRDVVILEETYAKSVIMHDSDQRRVGYINLPSFYADFSGGGGRTSWKDIRNEVRKLEKSGVEAIVFDLRNNGGGSLQDVVKMGGLFIKEGPIVQVRYKGQDAEVMNDFDKGIEWEGPMVVMVNEFSASASEIFAAAMKDYNRAVIVGSESTHGKGTVQRFLDLNQTLRNNSIPPLGSIKLTVQKFYRINGESTQLKGVTPHVVLPDNYRYIKTGEEEQEYAMEWDQIKSTQYAPFATTPAMKNAIEMSQKRVKESELFNKIDDNAKRWKAENETDVYTLNMEKFRAEQKAKDEANKAFNKLFKPIDELELTLTQEDAKRNSSDSSRQKRTEEWFKNLKKDVYLYEALQIAEDLQAGVE
jgi:carboxyl-terminal processing protease